MTKQEQHKPGRDSQREITRDFSTVDVLLIVILVGGIGSVFGAVLAQAFQDQRPLRAKMAADTLARQIEAHWLDKESASNARVPSSTGVTNQPQTEHVDLSEGTMGKDPWGRPFHYLVRDHQIFVWSDGSNGKSESVALPSLAMGGDDIGSIRKLRNPRP